MCWPLPPVPLIEETRSNDLWSKLFPIIPKLLVRAKNVTPES